MNNPLIDKDNCSSHNCHLTMPVIMDEKVNNDIINDKSVNNSNIQSGNLSLKQGSVKQEDSGDSNSRNSINDDQLDIGEHYMVRRSDNTWRKDIDYYIIIFKLIILNIL